MSLNRWRIGLCFVTLSLFGLGLSAQDDAQEGGQEETDPMAEEEAEQSAEEIDSNEQAPGADSEAVSADAQSETAEAGGESAEDQAGATPSEEDSTDTESEDEGEAEAVESKPSEPISSGVEALNDGIIGDNETSEYDLRIRELESRVNDLKERIFRSKAKLTLLTAALTGGSLGEGASLTIVHRNEMGGSYRLIEVNYFLDGAPLWQVNDDSGDVLSNGDNKVVWDGNIVEGSHTLSVELVYRGTGYRLFNYHENYTFTLRDSYTFSIEAGQQFRVDAIGFERGNLTLEPEERPAIRFDTKLTEEAVLESAKGEKK